MILLWLLIGENVLALIRGAVRYGPGHAVAGIVAAHARSTAQMLAFGPAVVLSSLYAAVLCGVGFVLVSRADVPSSGD